MGTNTGLGIGIGIPFKNNALGGDKPYFPPELKARMIGVWTNYGKKNTDADRNIIKNKIPNAGGDLEILNAAYKLNSGFGEYSEDFTTWTKSSKITSVDSESFDFVTNVNWNLLYYKSNIGKDIPSFKVRIKLKGEGKVYYNYVTSEGVFTAKAINSEEYITPISYNTKYTGETPVNCGFTIGISNECSGTITQIPNFEDAFVTDGINDLIISQKTVKEMIGDNDEITVISMIYYINTDVPARINITNDVRGMTAEDKSSQVFARNGVKIEGVGKLGIYGWSKKGTSTTVYPYFNILGDKTDYESNANYGLADDAKFCPVGEPSLRFMSKQAHYWSFMVIGKLTEDEINLIIGNYNLDRSLKPDILCNISKQGITNDNHAEFNDKLIDYSGNGRDVQMNNLAWKGGSGIAAKPFETIKDYTIVSDEARQKLTIYNEFSYKIKSNTPSYYWTVQSIIRDNTSYQVTIITDKDCYWINATSFINSEGNKESIRKKYPVLANTPTQVIICGLDQFEYPEGIEPTNAVSYVNLEYAGEITITFIPSHKGGLLLDGVNDFGKVIGMPIYKDYTVVIDREIFANTGAISSKNNPGAFVETAGNSVYSFGQATSGLNFISTRSISYLSKYSYCGQSITAGAAEDGTDMWLGTIRDNDYRFFNGAIYSLMSFPYSMSEFLIERQLKKHKLGTLYPDMVEFRPIVKSNVKWDIIEIWQENKSLYRPVVNDDKTGIYLKKDSTIGIYVKPYVGQKVSEIVYNGVSYTYLKLNSNGFYYKVVPITKSPQKITMTIEQDENYVKFEPVITSNVEYVRLDFYLNNYQKRINIGDYIPKDAYLRANLYLKNNVDELTVFTFNGVNIGYRRSSVDDTAFNINQIYNYDSPQEVNITIDEYIRYEDIVQPYPVLLRFKDESNKEVSYGDKIKVGSSITRIGSFNDCNLLKGIYTVNNAKLNGSPLPSTPHVVEKSMVFTCTATWAFDNNEPKCILSPRLLRIPNSSYKILGHIPDISGHGNHGKINNSAYEGMSGVNGYPIILGAGKSYQDMGSYSKIVGDNQNIINITSIVFITALLFSYVKNKGSLVNTWNKDYPSYKIKVTGIEESFNLQYTYLESSDAAITSKIYIENDGIYTIPKSYKSNGSLTNDNVWIGFSFNGSASEQVNLTIEILSEYEGAYCLDGVDDFVTIPTLSKGGKQVLMKVNWQSIAGTAILYDQRTNGGFAIFNRDFDTNENKVPAYRARNIGGSTYIDGILNEYIYASQLKDTTHNIVELYDPKLNIGTLSPRIGYSYLNSNYSQMSLYDFMLFDEISTDDKIKELNEYVGIEAKVELPPYYWDNYGKTNLDADKATIYQRGVAVGDYDLTNYNHAYEGMSGYNGYPVVFGANKTWANESNGYVTSITSNTIHITNVLNAGLALLYSYVKYNGNLQNIKEIPPFKIEIKGLEGRSKFIYKYLATSDATKETNLYLGNGTHELPKSFLPTEALINNAVVGFSISPIEEGVTNFLSDITIEVLPEYENGLAYDGVEDFSDNKNIPIFTDFTAIIKRIDLDAKNNNSAVMFKGNKIYESSIGNGFILDYHYNSKNYVYSYSKINQIERDDSKIIYLTPESYNGNPIIKGENGDNLGLILGKYWKGIIYKTILYSKTISLLEINFLKNLMEKDEIIDLTNPIFIKDE